MIVLSGADLVLPDHVLSGGALVVEHGRIASIHERADPSAGQPSLDGHLVVPGFIDAHVHGVDGVDTLDAGDAVVQLARALPRYGVTAFCPTTVACSPDDLRRVLAQVRACRSQAGVNSAQVLPAHLESNFINPTCRGAQPAACLRTWSGPPEPGGPRGAADAFTAAQILAVIASHLDAVATVTMAPEIDGGMELLAWLVSRGIRVSLGHSAATLDAARAAVAAGARQVTHLFNAMLPLHHRRPGLAGFALQCADLSLELICDGVHVHPSIVRMAIAAAGASRVLAVSDATAAAGLAPGAPAHLGGQTIRVGDGCAVLSDGTMAGSTTTLDGAFRALTRGMGVSAVDAAQMCSTTPARALGLAGRGSLVEGAWADLAVLDRAGRVVQTWVDGRCVFSLHDQASRGTSRRV